MLSVRLLVYFFYISIVSTHTLLESSTQKLWQGRVDFSNDLVQQLDTICTGSLYVERVVYSSDVHFPADEFYYLADMSVPGTIDAEHMVQFVHRLKKKQRFQSMRIVSRPTDQGVILEMRLVGLWRFDGLKIKGALFGRDHYAQYYLLEGGEPFEYQKHRASVAQIQHALVQEGFCSAHVHHYLTYNGPEKLVTAHMVLDPGAKFLIIQVDITFEHQQGYNAHMLDELRRKLIKLCTGRLHRAYYTTKLLNKQTTFLKKYLAKKGFWDATISLNEVVMPDTHAVSLAFTINLGEKKKFIFFGNHFFSDTQLLEIMRGFGTSTSFIPSSLLAQEIMSVYHDKGFWQVNVEPRQEDDRYFFIISEGARAAIKQVEVVGCSLESVDGIIRNIFATTKRKGWYSPETVSHDINRLVEYYHHHGYGDITIVSQEYIPLDQAAEYRLRITIDQGMQRFVSRVEIPGYQYICNQGPFADVKPSVPFNQMLVAQQHRWLIDWFHAQGYLYVEARPEVRERGQEVTLIWHLSGLDRQITFGKTIVRGNYKLPLAYILRELPFTHSDVWSKHSMDKGFVALRDLSIFHAVHIVPDSDETELDQQSVLVKVIEDDPLEIRLRGGFQQVGRYLALRGGSTYKVGGTFLYKNPFNMADHLRADIDASRFYRNFLVYYSRPWLFGKPIRSIIKGYTHKYNQPIMLGSKRRLYEAIQDGILIGLSRNFPHIDFGFNVGVEKMETRKLSLELARAISFAPILVDRKIPYFFFETSLMLEFLDDKLNPHKGSLTAISCKGMFPWRTGGVRFFKLLAEQSVFVPLARMVTLAARLRFGHIFNQEFQNIMPIERFYLGGANSLRSYPADHAPPVGSFIDDNDKRQFVPQGGKSMGNINIEVRFWLFDPIGFAIFQDFGALSKNRVSEVAGGDILAATGCGLRYLTPIGPLRFDVGFKWRKKDPDESWYAWYITFGHPF